MDYDSINKGCPWVVEPEMVAVPLKGWRIERPEMNHEKCCQCGICYLYCPTGCIIEEPAGFAINMDYCKGCGICAQECPNEAITMIKEARG